MNPPSALLTSLGANIGFVAVLALACSLLPEPKGPRFRAYFPALIGGLFGAVSVLGMKFPVIFAEGVLVDGKTILAPLAAYFYGPAAAAADVLIACGYRLYLGGVGTVPGMAILVSGAFLGWGFRFWRSRPRSPGPTATLALMGPAVVLLALGATCLLPRDLAWRILPRLWLPVCLLYPGGILLVGSLLEAIAARNRSVEEIRRGAEELRERNRFIETILNMTPDVLYIYDLEERRNVFSNRGVERALGLTPQALLDLGPDLLAGLMHPDDYRAYREEILPRYASLRDGDVLRHAYRLRHADGEWRWLVSNEIVYRRNPDATPRQVFGITHDITGLKQAEREREALIRGLEAKNAELERFTYTVSHDLKSPLITIKGFLRHIDEALAGGRAGDARADLKRVAGAADKMEALLTDLLELSRVGRLVNPAVEFPMGEAVDEALALTQGALAARGVRVSRPGAWPAVRADRARVVEIWQNLFENAAKYMGAQAAPAVEVGARNGGGPTAFYVKDNGMGIPPDRLERVFGLFEKLDPASPGTGVGLALVRRIAEAHGGRAWAESAPGAGSTFLFTLGGG